jgi:hypothetical protein
MIDFLSSESVGRREFLKKVLRTTLFGGFVLSGLHLATRPRTAEGLTGVCAAPEACGQCGRLGGCGERKAVRYKSLQSGIDASKKSIGREDGYGRP